MGLGSLYNNDWRFICCMQSMFKARIVDAIEMQSETVRDIVILILGYIQRSNHVI